MILNHMVQCLTPELDGIFSALGDPTRRAILARLCEGETSVSDLAAPHDMSLTAVAKHLRVLEGAGLVTRKKEGRVVRCSIEPEPLRDAAEWIAHYQRFWEARLDALADYFDGLKQGERDA